jgi:hypothetical protein
VALNAKLRVSDIDITIYACACTTVLNMENPAELSTVVEAPMVIDGTGRRRSLMTASTLNILTAGVRYVWGVKTL